MTFLRQFVRDTHGVTALEYALIAAFVAIVAYGGVTVYANQLGNQWNAIAAVPLN